VLAALLASASGAAHASITGVCPDGSIFVVQSAEAIPCAQAKRVEPGELPPLKPELLPRPFAWQVYQQQQDPNNPYNLVDAARAVREARAPAPGELPTPDAAAPRVQAARTRPEAAAPRPVAPASDPGPPDLGLSEQETRDLALIVELSQQRAPAGLDRASDGGAVVSLRVAPSAAFEARLREAWAGRGRSLAGPVLLFSVRAAGPGSFHPNFTFVQGHQAFHPDPEEPTQLGLLRGQAGEIGPESEVLGYVVLPAQVELAQPLDIYWDDRQITATLRP
jgi:hypothetical protein